MVQKNKSIQNEVKKLKQNNEKLQNENNNLLDYIKNLVKVLKSIFKKILYIGTREEKDTVVEEVINYYDNKFYNKQDIVDIANDTSRENELYDYANIDKDYYKPRNKDKNIDLDIEI